jgi:hypothetical protein
MGVFDNTRLINRFGTLRTSNDTDYVDMWGTIKTSAQFENCKTVDMYGDLGCALADAIGYLNYPGTTHIDTWTTDMETISTNRQLTANGTIGCLEGYTIIESGVINIAGFQFNIAGDATSLGPFNGGGKVIITSNNTAPGSASTIFAGATLQLGLNPCTTTGSLSAVPYTIQTGAVLNLYGAYTTSTNLIAAGNIVQSGATVNIEGCGTCGTGMINFANNSVAAGGIITTKNSYTVYPSANMGGSYYIGEGASTNWTAASYTGTIYLNSTIGWRDASCVEKPNIVTNAFNSGKIDVGVNGGTVGPTSATGSMTFSPTLSGSGPLQIGMPGNTGGYILGGNASAYTGEITIYGGQVQPSTPNALAGAEIRLGNPTSLLPSGTSGTYCTVKSVQSASPSDTTARLFISLVGLTITNQDPEPYYGTFASASTNNIIVQAGNFQIGSTIGNANQCTMLLQGSAKAGGYGGSAKYGGPLTVQTANGGLSLISKPSTLSVTTFTATSGFKVDIGANWAASPGTYTILTSTSKNAPVPTVGTNASGLTPTFAWVGNNLQMTLA